MTDARDRQPHAVLDEPSRILKARKIVALLGEDAFARAAQLLEVGCGSGVIAATLARLGAPRLQVSAVDVADNRLTRDGYAFHQVEGTTLPFPSRVFDVVVTNHVIEHVGDEDDQLRHLQEITRVLADDGVVYLAVPNRWRLVEPHYRLPLLSWLPARLADALVRATGRGTHYDCRPLDDRAARRLFRRADLAADNVTLAAVPTTLRIERGDGSLIARIAGALPLWTWVPFLPIIPTMIYRLRKTPAMKRPQ